MAFTASNITSTLNAIAVIRPSKNQGYQPKNSDGSRPPAFMFHYEGENKADFQVDITDHFTEDNRAIQDHAALKPIRVTVRGYIGEVNDVPPSPLFGALAALVGLPIISDFSPKLSVTAQNAYNKAFRGYQTASSLIKSGVSAWSSIGGNSGPNLVTGGGISNFNAQTGTVGGNQNKQQVAYQTLLGYGMARTLWTVQTPWAVFDNMMIESITAQQDDTTRMVSDFMVTFKMLRFASTVTAGQYGTPLLLAGPVADSGAPIVNQGASVPKTSTLNHIEKLLGVK